MRLTKEVRSDQCWAWFQNGDLKRETESLIVAAQNQSIRTNLVKAKIDKSQGDYGECVECVEKKMKNRSYC